MRIVKSVLLLFLLAAAALGIVRFFFLDQLTTLALNKAGLVDSTIHFSSLNLSTTRIDTLQATLQLPSGELLPVTLKNVSLNYSLRQLLTTGKCNRVSIGVMEIKKTALQNKTASRLSLPEHISLLRDDLRARLPLQELQINRLQLSGAVPEQVKGKSIQLLAHVNDTEVTLDLALQLSEDTRITVAVHSADARQARAVLTGMQDKEEIIKTTITLAPEGLSAVVALQLQPVFDLLQKTADSRKQVHLDGSLTAHLTLPLPLQETDNIQTSYLQEGRVLPRFRNAECSPIVLSC